MLARPEVATEQNLDELRNELAQVGMEAMDVLRSLPLGKIALRPGEIEVELAVEGFLSERHRPHRFDASGVKPCKAA